MAGRNKPKAFAYVDGYNLYYGLRASCGRGSAGWKWLDLQKLLGRLAPEYDVEKIYYFTAHINPPTWSSAKRQKRFLRALDTIPELTIVSGKFRTDPAEFPLASDPETMVEVLHTEEKESDVNLAVQLIMDGLVDKTATRFVVVTNDSDQVPPITLLRNAGHEVLVLNPHPLRPSASLKVAAGSIRAIRPSNVTACQFPETLTDHAGDFAKPDRW